MAGWWVDLLDADPVPWLLASDESAAIRSPRQACGDRAQFSLYRCMQQQCARSVWTNHLQCLRFRATDQID